MSVTVAPFLAGAVAGSMLSRRETQKLGDKVARDLAKRSAADRAALARGVRER